MQDSADVVVIGAGVIGASVAFHLAALGAGRVRVFERGRIGEGTSAQSSGILRTHYSVPSNVELALRSWRVYERFADELDDAEASAGLVRCGYLIAAPPGDKAEALRQSLADQRARGIAVLELDARAAAERLPIARFDGDALIGYEPDAGFGDATLVATSYARAARRRGVGLDEGVAVQGLLRQGERVTGVRTARGEVHAGMVVSVQNIWAAELQAWAGLSLPLHAERHRVLALQGPQAYTRAMPVFKDLASDGMLYARSYGGAQMLVSEGTAGEVLDRPDTTPGPIDMDWVLEVGAQVAARFPSYAEAGLASSWTGVYDVTPDWNPILGAVPGLDGLVLGCGFSGHGFKLAPAVGRVLAQVALGLPADVDLSPYALQRFAAGRLLSGRYGQGAVS
ncbi:MAG: FAD-binding oxidoreductase [Rubrivivax sp.]